MSQTFEQFLQERRYVPTASGLSDHDIDLWEHGCLLFSAFEWEAAAELFAQISRSIPSKLYSSLCLLNVAIIHARLGQFSNASQALEEVEHVEELLPITLCLMGHVEYELGSFKKSEDCFNIALGALDSFQVYEHLGLNFVLREEQIQQNLEVLQNPTIPGMIATIPGDILAEAPPRDTGTSMTTTGRRGTGQWSYHSASTSESLLSRPISAVLTIAPLVPTSPTLIDDREKHNELARPQHVVQAPEPISKASGNSASPLPSKKARIVARYSKLRAASKKVLNKRLSIKKAPAINPPDRIVEVQAPVKRIPRMVARDARPGGDTTADLSFFIKNLPNPNKLVARDARGQPESTGDLAMFFRETDPEDKEAATNMISRVSAESTSLRKTSLRKPGVSSLGGLHNASRNDSLPSMASHTTRQTGNSKPADAVSLQHRVDSLDASDSEVLGTVPQRSATSSNNRTWQSRNGKDSWPPKPKRYQPQAIHPAFRPGFSLD